MLQFIDENDFLKVDTFKENEDGTVAWVWNEGEGLPTHSGIIREGFKRYTQEQQGTEDVVVGQDDEGNDITEEQPVIVAVEIDVWGKFQELLSKEIITLEPLNIVPLQEAAKVAINTERDAMIASGVEFEGDVYQTNPTSVMDMLEAVVANRDTQWLTEDNTVVDMPVNKLKRLVSAVADLKELYIYKARQHKNNVLQLTSKEDIEQYLANLTW